MVRLKFAVLVLMLLSLSAGTALAQEDMPGQAPDGQPSVTEPEPQMALPQITPADAIAQPPQTSTQKVLEAKLMSGYPDGKFHPEGRVTRAQLASILDKTFRISERNASPAAVSAPHPTDVPTGYWAENAIQAAVDAGIMSGYKQGKFYPNHTVSRAEALAIFAQAYGVFQFDDATVQSTLSQYPDATQVPSWARKSMVTALKNGFVDSQPGQKLRPLQPMTRGDMAYTLDQYLIRLHESEQNTLPTE